MATERQRTIGPLAVLILLIAISVASWTAAGPAAAATSVTVTTLADELNADGDCSLREAVQAVNTGTAVDACAAGSNHIVLPVGRIALTAPLVVSTPMIVTGVRRLAGTTTDLATVVDGWVDNTPTAQNLFQVRPAATLSIEKMTIGPAVTELVSVDAGGGQLTLTAVEAWNDTAPVFVTIDSPTVVSDVIFANYRAASGTTQSGSITVSESTAASTSPCVFCATSGSITIQHSLTTNLRTTTGPISVDRSYVVSTQAPPIWSDTGAVTIDASSVSYVGSGVRVGGGVSTVRSSTVVGTGGPALEVTAPARLTATNSIVTCGSPSGAVRSGGHNLTDGSCGFGGAGDIVGDPKVSNTVIGPVRNVSMTIDTGFMPGVGSPAIDHGGDCGPIDQRGFSRPIDGDRDLAATCDIGAVEVRAAVALAGDWDGNGTDTPAEVVGNTFFLRNSSSKGGPSSIAKLGSASGRPVVGDWNGDGIDTIGMVQGDVWFLSNSNTAPKADLTVKFAVGTGTPVVGDWNGDGIDTPGVVKGNVWSIRNSNTNGGPDATFTFGSATSQPVVGDWNGDGTDSPGVVDAKTWHIVNGLGTGPVTTFGYGVTGPAVVGDWDGDGHDGPGRAPSSGPSITWFLRNSTTSGIADVTFVYGNLNNA